ncbi:MAG: MAPEG family protein [Gammaproteobacteria bacterium]|nr:MAPEG family protein [Gammaproteobacteria bacterium]
MSIWLLLLGMALIFTGLLVMSVNGPPRALRRSEPEGPTTTGMAEADARFLLRWIDQYAWIGVALIVIGAGMAIVALINGALAEPGSTDVAPPTALVYAGLHGLMLVFLSLWVLRYKVRSGTRGAATAERMSRVQGNFLEYVPMALILLWLVELGGAPAAIVHALGLTLFTARLLHAWGLGSTAAANYPRMIGALLTFVVLAMLGVTALYLGLIAAT